MDPLNSDKPKPTEIVIPDKNPSETDEQKEPQNHEPKPQLELDMDCEENEIIKHGTSAEITQKCRKHNLKKTSKPAMKLIKTSQSLI